MGTKAACRERELLGDGPLLHVFAAIVSGILASTFSAPADVVMTRYQSAAAESRSLRRSVVTIWIERGMLGFFRGWSANVGRLCPTFIFGSMIYEQTRRMLGLAYM